MAQGRNRDGTGKEQETGQIWSKFGNRESVSAFDQKRWYGYKEVSHVIIYIKNFPSCKIKDNPDSVIIWN
jgi:hypothetical protein